MNVCTTDVPSRKGEVKRIDSVRILFYLEHFLQSPHLRADSDGSSVHLRSADAASDSSEEKLVYVHVLSVASCCRMNSRPSLYSKTSCHRRKSFKTIRLC